MTCDECGRAKGNTVEFVVAGNLGNFLCGDCVGVMVRHVGTLEKTLTTLRKEFAGDRCQPPPHECERCRFVVLIENALSAPRTVTDRHAQLDAQLAAANKRATTAEHERDELRIAVGAPEDFAICSHRRFKEMARSERERDEALATIADFHKSRIRKQTEREAAMDAEISRLAHTVDRDNEEHVSACIIHDVSSRVCKKGTRSCITVHPEAVISSNHNPVTASDFAAVSWARGIGERILTARVIEAARRANDLVGPNGVTHEDILKRRLELSDAIAALDAAKEGR